ncbi:MAG: AsmA-like C-terminal domain-containing protein [Smithella sp.]
MAVKRRTITMILVSAIGLICLFASAGFYVGHKLSNLETFRETITKIAAEKINRDITFESGKANFSFRDGLALQFKKIIITEKDRSAIFVSAPKAFFQVKILPLLVNKVIFKEAVLDEPRLSLKRDRQGVLNIADLLEKEKTETGIEFRKLTINKGFASFFDQSMSEQGLLTALDDVDCIIDSPFREDTSRFRLNAFLVEAGNKAVIRLDGSYQAAPPEKPFYESVVDVSFDLSGTDLKHYNFYLKHYTPLSRFDGKLDLRTKVSGKLSDFTSQGVVTVQDVLIVYPEVFRNHLQPRKVFVDYAINRSAGNLKLDIARLTVDRFGAKGNFAVEDMDTKNPLFTADAVTSVVTLKDVRPYVPWKIIHRDVVNFIEAHIKDGNVRLIEGKLNGRKSQLADMSKKESASVVYVRAEVNKCVFEAHPEAPVFYNISGILEMKKRQFALKNMKGIFGSSPCTLDGSISDYALPSPNIYTAEMKMQPEREEILWLIGKEKFSALRFKGPSALHLSGKGPIDKYQISANWNLTDAAYAYPEVMEKPAKRKNNFKAEIILNDDAVNFSSFYYDLPPVSISGSSMFFYAGGRPVSLNVQSGSFDLQKATPILPVLRDYNPAGNCSLDFAVKGDLNDPASMQWKGNVALDNVSLNLPLAVKTIKGLTGKVVFNGSKLETSPLKLQIGESAVEGKFSIDDFHDLKLICQFNSDLLRTADIGLISPEGAVNVNNVEGKIAVADDTISVGKLSFGLGESKFNLSGAASDWTRPKITLALTSPYVNYDDFARLLTLDYEKQKDAAPVDWQLHANVLADAGKFNGVDFKNLNTGLKYAKNVVDIERLEAAFFEGKIKASGKIGIEPDGQNHYAANIALEKISLDKLQRYLDLGDRMVTGKLSLKSDITAAGRNADDFKKTMAGTVHFRTEKGVMKKFSVLSKIFSLLNVYQLFKLQVPDMAKDGMPYNHITAHMSFKNGVTYSEDFFIDSDAMKISIVGKIDYLNKKVDYIAGIHPLQTIDRIAAKIPIAGWLITDEKGNLITVDFKIDGSWDNPNVSPIPATSIAKGTLEMFKRILNWPEKLFTDTGEVLFGH